MTLRLGREDSTRVIIVTGGPLQINDGYTITGHV